MTRVWDIVVRLWKPAPTLDLAEHAEKIQRDDERVAELTAREGRILRENHLGPSIKRALEGR